MRRLRLASVLLHVQERVRMWAEGREAELAVRFIFFRHLPVSGTAPVHVRLGAIRPATPTPTRLALRAINTRG